MKKRMSWLKKKKKRIHHDNAYKYVPEHSYTHLYTNIHIDTYLYSFGQNAIIVKMPLLFLTKTLQNCHKALQTKTCLQMCINTYKHV